MIVAALAPLFFVSLAQSPPSDYEPTPGEAYQEEERVNGFEDEAVEEPDPAEAAGESDEPVERMADEADVDAAQEPEEGEDMVCRRVHYVDDFGRQRSRKSCRPR